MKYSTAAVALGAVSGAAADGWSDWSESTTTTSSTQGAEWTSTTASPTESCPWSTIQGVTTVPTSSVCPSYTGTGPPAWFSELPSSVQSSIEAAWTGAPSDWCLYTAVAPTSTTTMTTWVEWVSATSATSVCSASSTSTVWVLPTGSATGGWAGVQGLTVTETDTVTVWVMPSGGYSTEWPAGTGAASAGGAASPTGGSGGSWGAGSWPNADQTWSNAANWVWTASLPTSTDWLPAGPSPDNCTEPYTPLQENSCNTPDDRQTWCDGFDINTNYYEENPETGHVCAYEFEITNGTANFDGEERMSFLINGQSPGPLIECNWGDTVQITVKNSLQNNGTAIHWHGVRQWGTVSADGVPGITECAIAPGETRTYTWLASAYGTSWYHSHWLTQYGDGVRGPIVIHGPATANYDIDMGPVVLSDLFYITAAQAYDWISHNGPGGSKNYLLNGHNTDANNTNGLHSLWTLQPGKRHRFRLVNTAAQNMFSVHFDGHEMEVIQSDFVPIQPYTTDWLNIAIGQRYDVIITANQPSGNYFLRAVTQTGCPAACDNTGLGSSNGILNYAGATLTLPQSDTGNKTLADFGFCADEPLASLIPWVAISPDDSTFAAQASTLPAGSVVETQTSDDGLYFRWFINNGYIDVNYTSPSLQSIADNTGSNETISNALFISGTKDQWVYFVIQNQFFAGHPMHLHGHDFCVLGQQSGSQSPTSSPTIFGPSDIASLNFNNPARRDTALLIDNGWTVIGFPTDNPGVWLMHCHIVWHIDGGLGMQFVENQDQIGNYVDEDFQNECNSFIAYDAEGTYRQKTQGESGLRRRWMDKLMRTPQTDVVRRSSNSEKRYLDSHLKRGLGDGHKHRHVARR